MFSELIFSLNLVILGTTSPILFQCNNTTTNSIHSMCRSPDCNTNTEVQAFCEYVFEQMFRCPSRYIPISFVCDGIRHCENGIDEEAKICNRAVCKRNFYKCDQSKCIPISKLCDGFKDCENGLDESPLACRKLISQDNITCPMIFKQYHTVACYIRYGNKPGVISCKGRIPPMTVAQISCTPFYTSTTSVSYQKLVCQNNGSWSQNIINCKPDCGIVRTSQFSPLILNGWLIKPTLWPWYAALFDLQGEEWKFFCSATVISTNLVITAAHCVWNMPEENIRVAAGKYYSDFYSIEPGSQVSDVEKLILHPLYQDSLGNYASDIALVVLSQKFSFSEYVLPICLNLTLRNFIQENNDGRLDGAVVGMGITENGSISSNLKGTTVQIISNADCISTQKYEFRKYVTISSFCAGDINRTGACNGDSGSGLARKNKANSKWTLEGVVSISPKNPNALVCDISYYTIFTNVGMYSDWIYYYGSQYGIDYLI